MFQLPREQKIVMCYVCRLHPRPGALDVAACIEKRVPPGPLLGQLKSGKDITLPDGTVVLSKDVCFPDDPGPVMLGKHFVDNVVTFYYGNPHKITCINFLVVDCPSVEYLNSFLNQEAFTKHQASATCDNDFAYLVVHFTPSHIFKKRK